jgi:hypothetical protein
VGTVPLAASLVPLVKRTQCAERYVFHLAERAAIAGRAFVFG